MTLTYRPLAAALLTIALILPAAGAYAAPAPIVATDAGAYFASDRPAFVGLAYIWESITETPASDFDSWSIEAVSALPTGVTEIDDYHKGPGYTLETAWAIDANTPSFVVQLRAVGISSDGTRTESNVVNFDFYPQVLNSPASGTPPTGTHADWAWTAPWATVSNKIFTGEDLWSAPMTGTYEPWSNYAKCLAIPFSDVVADNSGGEYPAEAAWMGEMTSWNVQAGYSDGQHTAPSEVAIVEAFQPEFTSSITVDVAGACPNLDLTGAMYIVGGDTLTGTFTLSDEFQNRAQAGNHLRWTDGQAQMGQLESSDVTATPLPDGTVRFDFLDVPDFGEAGSGGVSLRALRTDGTQVLVHAAYSFTNYGGAPAVDDSIFYVDPGETLHISEADLTKSARSSGPVALELGTLPDSINVDTSTGSAILTFVAPDAAGEENFAFSVSETQAPAGRISSAPANARIIVGTPAAVPSAPPASPGFSVNAGISEESPDEVPTPDEVQTPVSTPAPASTPSPFMVGFLIGFFGVTVPGGFFLYRRSRRALA